MSDSDFREDTPYMFAPGDMGEYGHRKVTTTADGQPVYARTVIKKPIYCGGYDVGGQPIKARQY